MTWASEELMFPTSPMWWVEIPQFMMHFWIIYQSSLYLEKSHSRLFLQSDLYFSKNMFKSKSYSVWEWCHGPVFVQEWYWCCSFYSDRNIHVTSSSSWNQSDHEVLRSIFAIPSSARWFQNCWTNIWGCVVRLHSINLVIDSIVISAISVILHGHWASWAGKLTCCCWNFSRQFEI